MQKNLRATGYDFSYLEKGSGEPLVLVHGSLLDFRYWESEVNFLSCHFNVIALSRRYHWPNARPDGAFNYSSEGHINDLITFLETLNKGPVHLLGHSYGGYMAVRLAALCPEKIRSLILVEPGGQVENGEAELAETEKHGHDKESAKNKAAKLITDGYIREGVAHFMDTVCLKPLWKDCPLAYQQITIENATTAIEQVKETRPKLRKADIATIICPTLLIGGSDTPIPFVTTLNRLQMLIPQARRVSISRASHLVNQDNSDEFATAVRDFITVI